jgi:hypothetical protein
VSGERKRPAGGNPIRSPQELATVLGQMASQTADPKPRPNRYQEPPVALSTRPAPAPKQQTIAPARAAPYRPAPPPTPGSAGASLGRSSVGKLSLTRPSHTQHKR